MNAGLIAGLLDAFCYVGSAITTFGLGSVSDVWGWNAVFYLMLELCALMMLVAILFPVADKKCKKLNKK